MRLASCLAALLVSIAPSLADEVAGVTSLEIGTDDTSRTLGLSIWYPATEGAAEEVGGNAVFVGAQAIPDAAPKDGTWPLVVVSHGGLRSAADSGAWLSSALAQAGYVAVEVNGPRAKKATDGVNEIWQRPADVSRAVDAILSDPQWSGRIGQRRISVVGFALGGTAALAVAGGAFDHNAFVHSCDEGSTGPDCMWFQAQEVPLDSVDAAQFNKSRLDPRVGATVAIEPEYLQILSSSLESVAVPSLVIKLGTGVDLAETGNLSQASLSNANKFDAFPACTPKGPFILKDDGGDPAICGESAESRFAMHNEVAKLVVSFLASGMAPAK